MRRYRIGDIAPEWQSPAPPGDPIFAAASDRTGFGVLARGGLSLYRLGHGVLGSSAIVEAAWTLELGESKRFAVGPGSRTLAFATGPSIEIGVEGRGVVGAIQAPADVVALAYSASGKTLWAVVMAPGQEQGDLHAWNAVTLAPIGQVQAYAYASSAYDLSPHPDAKLERVGIDAAAGQDGSSFTFAELTATGLSVLPGSHDGPDGVALGGLAGNNALLISREAVVLIDVTTGDRVAGPARATLKWMRDEMIFDYQRGYVDDYWVVSGRFDDRDEDDARAAEDLPEGRLRIYDAKLDAVLEMPSTTDLYDTPWAVLGLVRQRVLICQSDAVMLYNLQPALTAR
jgi:hypothetical protein